MTGYNPSEGTIAKGLRKVAAALAYDDPKSGETKIIMPNQAILIPHLDVHLLCPSIGLDIAKKTVKATMQRGLQTVLYPSLSRRFKTNDCQLRYRRLNHDLYTDTLCASVRSHCGNKYDQVFTSTHHWYRAFPMEWKAHVHEGFPYCLPMMVCHQLWFWMAA